MYPLTIGSCLVHYAIIVIHNINCIRCHEHCFIPDIDECLENPCQDVCTNTPGSFTCSCTMSGYRVGDDSVTCVGKKHALVRT